MTAPSPGLGPGPVLLGTWLRHLLDRLDGDVAAGYPALGLDESFRPRFTPVILSLAAAGPVAIRELAATLGVTHSAASQTVAQLVREELVVLAPGADARQRIVRLTPKAASLLPTLEREWAATTAAAAAFEAELSYPLGRLITEALAALDRRPMRDRIAAELDRLGADPGSASADGPPDGTPEATPDP
jgi:DNA-binding MarR family transcriptional regulator